MTLPATIVPADVLVAARLAVQSYSGKPDAVTFTSSLDGVAVPPHIVFEGSVTFRDWIADFEALPNDAGEFIGFAIAAASYANDIITTIRGRTDCASCGLTLVGHSRGGALAWLVATRLRKAFAVLPLRVITFGAPGPGTHAWGRAFARLGIPSLRVEASYDPVVHLVPWWYGASVGSKLHLDHDGTELGRIRGGWATVKYWLRWKLGDRYDHSVSGYQAAVEQWVLKKVDT